MMPEQTIAARSQELRQIERTPRSELELSRLTDWTMKQTAMLRGAIDVSRLEVMAWDEILPELKGALDAKRRNSRLINLIVFLIVALGVLNTMTMSTFERTREFGVMASLGTRRGRILGASIVGQGAGERPLQRAGYPFAPGAGPAAALE